MSEILQVLLGLAAIIFATSAGIALMMRAAQPSKKIEDKK